MKKIKLTKYEQQIENHAEEFIPASKKTKDKLKKIIDASNKSRSITLRVNENELYHIRSEAKKEGVPYQTLITSIIHKYITKQLINEADIKKALHLLKTKSI